MTNGVTPRRWIVLSNPKLDADPRRIGVRWVSNLEEELRRVEPLAAIGFRRVAGRETGTSGLWPP